MCLVHEVWSDMCNSITPECPGHIFQTFSLAILLVYRLWFNTLMKLEEKKPNTFSETTVLRAGEEVTRFRVFFPVVCVRQVPNSSNTHPSATCWFLPSIVCFLQSNITQSHLWEILFSLKTRALCTRFAGARSVITSRIRHFVLVSVTECWGQRFTLDRSPDPQCLRWGLLLPKHLVCVNGNSTYSKTQ